MSAMLMRIGICQRVQVLFWWWLCLTLSTKHTRWSFIPGSLTSSCDHLKANKCTSGDPTGEIQNCYVHDILPKITLCIRARRTFKERKRERKQTRRVEIVSVDVKWIFVYCRRTSWRREERQTTEGMIQPWMTATDRAKRGKLQLTEVRRRIG